MIAVPHKIVIPQQPPHLVVRPRLSTMLDGIRERQLVLLTAPAGYGKTSLLVTWTHETIPFPVCWYSMDRYDADPHLFMQYLTATLLQRFGPRLPLTAGLMHGGALPSIESAIATVAQEVLQLGELVVLVFDDWHFVTGVGSIEYALAELLRRAPNVHAIVSSRTYPSIPDLMLLTAHNQVTGLAESMLRFTPDEAADVLKQQRGDVITMADIVALTEKANGWITAILLLSRSAEHASQKLAIDYNSERRVYDFLAEQVFDQLDADLQVFLSESALLEELQSRHCDALLQRSNSGLLLDHLLRQHLFVSAIDNGVLQYHPLFREFLIERFQRTNWTRFYEMALRIATAYADQGQWAQAFTLCLLANDAPTAQHMLDRGGEALYRQGQFATLEHCFDRLPFDTLSATLLCLKGRLRLNRGHVQEATALADMAQARMHDDDMATVRLYQATVMQSCGNYTEAIALATFVLTLASTDDSQRGAALRIAANCHARQGNTDDAIRLLHDALHVQRRAGDMYSLALIFHNLGMIHEHTGRLRDAETYYSQAEGYWTTLGNVGARALSRNSSAVILHLLGQYREAHQRLHDALHDARTSAVSAYEATIGASLGDLYCDLQLWDQAEQHYHAAKLAHGSAFIQSYLAIAEIRLLLARGMGSVAAAALEHLDERTLHDHAQTLHLLHAWVAYDRQQLTVARANAMRVSNNDHALSPDSVRAKVLEARILFEDGPQCARDAVVCLNTAVQQAQQLGHDAFLVALFAQQPGVLRQATLVGWTHGTDFIRRVENLQHVAHHLTNETERPIICVRALGIDEIDVNGELVDIGLLKAREVWFYLLSHPRGAVADELRELLWPDRDIASTRYLLRTAIHRLRSVLPPDLIVLQQRRLYRIDRQSVHIEYDVDHFLHCTGPAVQDRDLLMDGINSYRGPFLPWSTSQWSHEIRATLEQRFIHTIHRCAQLYEHSDEHAHALPLYLRAIALDALDEFAVAGVMRCHVALSNRAAAIEWYHRTRRRLDEEIGLPIDRSSEMERLYTQILHTS